MFRRTLSIAAAAALVLAGALVVQPAAATDPPIVTGNGTVECKAAGYDWGVKLDTGTDGTYTFPVEAAWEGEFPAGYTLVVKVEDNHFWIVSATPLPDAILVKAGTNYDIFTPPYPALDEEGLTPSNTKGISHITFCYDQPSNEPNESLDVTKEVNTSFNRTHKWSLDKKVDANEVYLYAPGGAGSGMQTVNWALEVTYGGYDDTDFLVYGTVWVTNDGDAATVVADVVDTMTIAGVETDVALSCGTPAVDFETDTVVLQVGETLTCTYSQPVNGKVEGFNEAVATTLTNNDYGTDAPESITWGDPANETNESVSLSDVSNVPGAPTGPWVFNAATGGGTVPYSTTFKWADYPKCGDFPYKNTATLTSPDSALSLQDSETVNVHVQCRTFVGETAWAANAGAGTKLYNAKGGGNWATYVEYPKAAPVEKIYRVFAGQTIEVGTATVTPVIVNGVPVGVRVTVNLIDDPAWEFANAVSNLKIEAYYKPNTPKGNPSPGLFTYKTSCTPGPATCTSGVIPVADFYGIHMDVGVWVPDPLFGP